MKYSKQFSHKSEFFRRRSILSDNAAIVFVLEEAMLVLLAAVQLYNIFRIEHIAKAGFTFLLDVSIQNFLWLFSTIIFFLIGYFTIALRDEKVGLIHKNFTNVLIALTQYKVKNASRQKTVFVFVETAYAVILAVAIFIYLDPDINLVPYPWNYIGFAVFLGLGLLLFSHTKDFRQLIYGLTPMQKRIHQGKHETRRFTNSRTGSIRVAHEKHYRGRHRQ
ncbi:Uncharacterised protein [uncultured archaeon]|nr:Uncharacterised protein [uncultured archaeon]